MGRRAGAGTVTLSFTDLECSTRLRRERSRRMQRVPEIREATLRGRVETNSGRVATFAFEF